MKNNRFFRYIFDNLNRMYMQKFSKFRPQNIKSRCLTSIKRFLNRFMNFKPKDENDYYSVIRWLVSKRLALFIVLLVGFSSLFYVFFISPVTFIRTSSDGIRVYKYNAIALRYVTGEVKIKSKKGDIAYEGYVSNGKANGDGKLYYENGKLMYEGDFVNNEYCGNGTEYYESGITKGSGVYKDNLLNGEGISFRGNGSREYAGGFKDGKAEGECEYYDSSSNLVYKGNFINGYLMYTDLLGKSAEEISQSYRGKRIVYYNDDDFIVVLPGIQAAYGGSSSQNPLEDSITAVNTYVMQPELYIAGEVRNNIEDIKKVLGDPVYEGNTYLNMAETVTLINDLDAKDDLGLDPQLELKSNVDNVYNVESYNNRQLIYIYTFEYEGVQYTFYCKNKNADFDMYMLQKCE